VLGYRGHFLNTHRFSQHRKTVIKPPEGGDPYLGVRFGSFWVRLGYGYFRTWIRLGYGYFRTWAVLGSYLGSVM
jgi:hypothetical protein